MIYWNPPKLWPALFYSLLALFGYLSSETWSDRPLMTLIGGGMTLIGIVLAGTTVSVYGGTHLMEILDGVMKALTRTRQSTAAEAVRQLTADQTALVRMTGEISIGLRLTARGPRYLVEGTGVPLDFVKYEFLPRCAMDKEAVTHLAPIGSWADGKTWKDYGQCRTLARRFTQYLVDNGLAVWGQGNQSASLVGDLTVYELRKALGMVDRMEFTGGDAYGED